MNGQIKFASLSQMAEFLREFTGASATFEAYETDDGGWILKFTGGC